MTPTPRPTLWERASHKAGTCDPRTCPLCAAAALQAYQAQVAERAAEQERA